MADALAKYRAALKRYRKEHPNTPYATAQKKVSAEMKSGAISSTRKKRKKVGSQAPAKRLTGTRRKRTTAKPVKVSSTRRISGVAKGEQLLRKIEKLEIKRREARAMELKDIIQVEINKLHDQLDVLRGHKRRKTA